MPTFTEEAWRRNEALFQKTLAMPFNRELADGTLSAERFRHYMIQDAHYLVAFGRALAVAAARADDSDTVVQLAAAAQEAVVGERELHNGFMKQHGVTPEQFAATPLSPTAEHYTSYLLATAWGEPWPVAMAALLPCFWIYAEVGRDIHARSKPGNPWQAWVDTYAAEEFHEAVAAMRDTLDRIAAAATPAMRERMHAAYTQAARLEWMFWDAAYRLEAWPV